MRVVLATEGSRGDVQPLVVLGESFAAAGHQVLLCGPPESAELAEGRVAYQPVGLDIRQEMDRMAGAMVGGSDLAFARHGAQHMRRTLVHQFADLAPHVAGAEFLITGGIQMAGPSLAERAGIPHRFLAYTPLLLESAEHAAVGVTRQGLPRWLNRLTWWLTRWGYHQMLAPQLNRQRAELGLDPLQDTYAYLLTQNPWVATDPALAPLPRDARVAARQIGFLFEREGPALGEKLQAFLDAGPPPLYLGFGSMPDPDPATTTRVLLEAVRMAGCRAVISRGWARLGDVPLPEDVFVTGPVCHQRLFSRVAAVVHHGGSGTTSTSARAGVPQFIVPHAADQPYFARRAWMAGVSPGSLPRRRLAADRLAEGIRACLENEVMAARAREFGARLRANDAVARASWPALLEESQSST